MAKTIDPTGWLHTGDLAYFDEDACFFTVGRLKELIKCKGYQVGKSPSFTYINWLNEKTEF